MFADPQFWVAVSFVIFIAVIFNPVRKILISSLDSQINEIKSKIDETENLKNEAQETLSELKSREAEIEKEINELNMISEKRIAELKESSSRKLSEQIEKKKILAENKIEQLIRDTNIYIKNYISNEAIEATSKILRDNLSKEKKSDIINDSVKELKIVLKD